ncbi:hypothetical protein EV182_002443, partial [Spiromyces aspiralis]
MPNRADSIRVGDLCNTDNEICDPDIFGRYYECDNGKWQQRTCKNNRVCVQLPPSFQSRNMHRIGDDDDDNDRYYWQIECQNALECLDDERCDAHDKHKYWKCQKGVWKQFTCHSERVCRYERDDDNGGRNTNYYN